MSVLLDPAARIVIAHRGNSSVAPENTAESLRQAVALGADAVEFDVRMTRDGIPVLMHDPTLDRTTSGRGALADVVLGEVRTLDASRGNAAWRGGRLPVPTLEEVLEEFRATPMVIEVKEMGAADATTRMVLRFGLQGSVIVGSGAPGVAERLYRSGVPAIASRNDALLLLALAVPGIRPPRPDYSVLSIEPRLGPLPVPVGRMASAARSVGIPTQIWTVNDVMQAEAFWRAGVAGVITDTPEAMLRARPK